MIEENRLGAKLIERNDARYEAIRRDGIFNARKPARFPPAIVMAETVDDVIAAVRLAKARGLRIGVRSGGHSWVAPHTRDDALLINLSRLHQVEIDAAARVAVVSPSTKGQILGARLRELGLFFPTGHCADVGLGGFVMCGGHGWNSRVWGPACASLMALDIVTAEGELIHASETENADWLWAARGSGPGFFGVAVRFWLALKPLPEAIRISNFVLPHALIGDAMSWVRDTCAEQPRCLESVILSGGPVPPGHFRLGGIAIGDADEVAAALAMFEGCPLGHHAIDRKRGVDVVVPNEDRITNPPGFRYAVDNVWLNAPSAAFVPLLEKTFTHFPTPLSYAFWQTWGPCAALPDMAYSVQGDIYVSANAVYEDAADDARCEAWVTAAMGKVAHLSEGAQLNDENMIGRPTRYLSATAEAKLEALRARHDPGGRFVSFLR